MTLDLADERHRLCSCDGDDDDDGAAMSNAYEDDDGPPAAATDAASDSEGVPDDDATVALEEARARLRTNETAMFFIIGLLNDMLGSGGDLFVI